MSFLVYYFILYLCVSMHACSSRHLSVFHKEPGKELRNITSKIVPVLMAELERTNYVNEDRVELKESKLEFPLNEYKIHKGSDIKVQISQEEYKVEGWKNHVRSTMESKIQDSKEDINKSEVNSITEDVVVMDYAQPHRKPPIHNIQP
ncbi:uncharacterized protein LOC143627128 [Bidens hawaiensis]|uniref:uncharacterized protein LOC143627128 n=1 Tax=Bidens hawaiensis TaxID=980011 RepID=UPI004048F42C